MRIEIMVYSKSGNTYSVAEKLHKNFFHKGYSSNIYSIDTESTDYLANDVESRIEKGDVIIFCAPVHGFSLCKEMNCYMDRIKSLKGKKVACFVTQYFKFPFLGGTKAIRQMTSICERKYGEIYWKGVIGWSSKYRESNINETVEAITSLNF